jgi:hypothetical protein
MAFISEVNFSGGGGVPAGEFVEVTLGPNDDPADFVVSVYLNNGGLATGVGITGGEVTLSTLTGVPDPQSPGFIIYVIPVGLRNGSSDNNEGSAIALTDTSTGGGVIDFYGALATGPITATAGAAAGNTSDALLNHTALGAGQSYQWDLFDNLTLAAITNGDAVLCLTQSCNVKTMRGPIPAVDLELGDLVWTLDHAYQPIRWIGKRTLTERGFLRNPKQNPVCIKASALAPGVPTKDITLSPQHRVIVRSPVAQRMYGCPEVLAAAKKLNVVDNIDIIDHPKPLIYIHLLFDQHEILDVNGALVESLLLGPCAGQALKGDTYKDNAGQSLPASLANLASQSARPVIEGKKGKKLLLRILENLKAIQPEDPCRAQSVISAS